MPVRTINYTRRKRILREDARISIRDDNGGKVFDVSLNLAKYHLPGDAYIYVEAYRQLHYMRFDYGQVGAIRIPEIRQLSDFGSADGVLFRVKVVKGYEPHGLLLAEADQIRPRSTTDDDDNRIPLLPVKPDENMGDEIWRIEFDGQQTLLLINSTLGDWRAIVRHPVFLSLVYPAALRFILVHILTEEGARDTDDMEDWRSRWLRFAVSLPGVSDPPRDDADDVNIQNWIDNAVSAFSRHHNFRTTFERYWTGAQEQ